MSDGAVCRFEQFRRAANVYFLLVVLIQTVPGVSPFPLWTTVAPLVFILGLSALKDGYEDYVSTMMTSLPTFLQVLLIRVDRFVTVKTSGRIARATRW